LFGSIAGTARSDSGGNSQDKEWQPKEATAHQRHRIRQRLATGAWCDFHENKIALFASPQAKSEKWGVIMTNSSTFSTEGDGDFTQDHSASITPDYVTLFTYKDGREISPGTVEKGALKELTALYPYNFLDDTEYLVHQTDTGKKYYHEDSVLSPYTHPHRTTVCSH
jgi:hypothetical protein